MEKVDKLEKDLILNKKDNDEIEVLQTENLESLDNFNNKVAHENETRENQYQEIVKESQNNNLILENKINDLNQNQEKNINEISNKLIEFKKQQIIINEQNNKEMDQLNKGISEQIKELDSIKRSLANDKDNNKIVIEKRIDELEKEINEWLEYSKKLDKLMEQNMKENETKLKDINNQMINLKQDVNDKFKEMKIYVDATLENYSAN